MKFIFFLTILNQFYILRFSDLEQDHACQEDVENEQLVACVHGYHTAVGKLLACEREWKNAVDTLCGSKDRWFIGH